MKKDKPTPRTPSNAHQVFFYEKTSAWEKALYQLGYKFGSRDGKAEVRKALGLEH